MLSEALKVPQIHLSSKLISLKNKLRYAYFAIDCRISMINAGRQAVGEVKKVGKSRNFQPKVGKSRNFSPLKVGKSRNNFQ